MSAPCNSHNNRTQTLIYIIVLAHMHAHYALYFAHPYCCALGGRCGVRLSSAMWPMNVLREVKLSACQQHNIRTFQLCNMKVWSTFSQSLQWYLIYKGIAESQLWCHQLFLVTKYSQDKHQTLSAHIFLYIACMDRKFFSYLCSSNLSLTIFF